MNKNTFKAQALAMVMVVLVVASIIGVSLFSRMSKDKQSSIEQQDSSVSSTLVDAALDFFIGADIAKIEAHLNDPDTAKEFTSDNIGDIAGALVTNGILDDIEDLYDGEENNEDDMLCEEDDNITVKLSYAEEEDYVEVQPGSVMAYNLMGANINNTGCDLSVKMKAMNDVAVFIVKRVMENSSTGEITESVENYCISQSVSDECNIGDVADVDDFNEDIWSPTTITDDARTLPFDLVDEADNKDVVEIRFLPLKGVLAVNSEHAVNCVVDDERQFRAIKITAEANCNGAYRGKEMFLPGSGNLGYATLFDYGIYDTGLFQP